MVGVRVVGLLVVGFVVGVENGVTVGLDVVGVLVVGELVVG